MVGIVNTQVKDKILARELMHVLSTPGTLRAGTASWNVKENDQKKKEAQEKGILGSTEDLPAAPRDEAAGTHSPRIHGMISVKA